MDEGFRITDPVVVARYLQLRSHFHDNLLMRVENLILDRFQVSPSRRIPATLVGLVRLGFTRPGEGELWPVVFLTAVDISLALCVQISTERLGSLGTRVNGPQRIRRRSWEGWWGWENPLPEIRPGFFDLSCQDQDDLMVAWYTEHLEWLAQCSLMRKREGNPGPQ
jgi:hypothetical protein